MPVVPARGEGITHLPLAAGTDATGKAHRVPAPPCTLTNTVRLSWNLYGQLRSHKQRHLEKSFLLGLKVLNEAYTTFYSIISVGFPSVSIYTPPPLLWLP